MPALILDDPRNFDETLYIMELGNLQLAELEAYDRLLDETVEWAYRDVGASRMRATAKVMRQLSEIHIDLARLSDELSNITKFFGDWHLARIYQSIAARFHLAEWHRTSMRSSRRWTTCISSSSRTTITGGCLVLEMTIVLLFVVDLVVLILGLKK